MKNIPTLLLLCICSFASYAQSNPVEYGETGGEYPIGQNDADHPCLSPEQYALIETQNIHNLGLLGLPIAAPDKLLTTSLNWPLKSANGLNDCSYYTVSAYVDQNTTVGAFGDYDCGANTYDEHKGTDIASFPFGIYKMDHDQVQVIAAAAGVIINKVDGNFDKNCGANNLSANYLVIQHADGSTALYLHMKKNSLSTKAIGQSVAQGEYLGVVGSSGNSSGPHLHFEVWSGSTVATRIDPFSGACNLLNASSWWASQKPHREPAIVKASVHTTDIMLPGCPETEIPNESSCYALPFQGAGLPPNAAKFYIFIRNETSGLTANLSILNPNGSVFNSWTYTSAANYNTSLRSWTKNLPSTPGTYTFQTTYNGITCSSTFDIMSASITANGALLTSSAATGNQWYLNGNLIPGAILQTYTATQNGAYTVQVTNAHGCSAISASFNFIQTGTETISGNNTILLVPNPNHGIFTLNVSSDAGQMTEGEIEIYNLIGEKVWKGDLDQPATFIDISAQPRGIYFAKISSAGSKYVLKVIKS